MWIFDLDGKSCTHSFTVQTGPGWIWNLLWTTTLLSWIQFIFCTAPPSIKFWFFVQSHLSFHILHPVGNDFLFVRVTGRDDSSGCAMCFVLGEYICFVSISGIWCGNTRNMWCGGEDYEKGGTRTDVSTCYEYLYAVVGSMTRANGGDRSGSIWYFKGEITLCLNCCATYVIQEQHLGFLTIDHPLYLSYATIPGDQSFPVCLIPTQLIIFHPPLTATTFLPHSLSQHQQPLSTILSILRSPPSP